MDHTNYKSQLTRDEQLDSGPDRTAHQIIEGEHPVRLDVPLQQHLCDGVGEGVQPCGDQGRVLRVPVMKRGSV